MTGNFNPEHVQNKRWADFPSQSNRNKANINNTRNFQNTTRSNNSYSSDNRNRPQNNSQRGAYGYPQSNRGGYQYSSPDRNQYRNSNRGNQSKQMSNTKSEQRKRFSRPSPNLENNPFLSSVSINSRIGSGQGIKYDQRQRQIPQPFIISDINRNKPQTKTDVSKCAFCTMCIHNERYIAGALVWGYACKLLYLLHAICFFKQKHRWSIKQSGTKASIILMVDKKIASSHKTFLQNTKLFDDICTVDILEFTALQRRWKKYEQSKMYDWINMSFTKFNVFEFTNYAKILMLDCDQICLRNCDELFQLPTPAGICSLYSDVNERLQRSKHGYLVSNNDIRKAYQKEFGIRGCLFLITPSAHVSLKIKSELQRRQQMFGGVGNVRNCAGGDEQFLSEWYMNNDSELSHWTHISSQYARLSYIDKTEMFGEPYFLHFCTFKPWIKPLNNQWKYQQWEDIAIWMAAGTQLMQDMQSVQSMYGSMEKLNGILWKSEWIADVRKQLWSKKYFSYQNSSRNEFLLGMYRLMKQSFVEMKAKEMENKNSLKLSLDMLSVKPKLKSLKIFNVHPIQEHKIQNSDVIALTIHKSSPINVNTSNLLIPNVPPPSASGSESRSPSVSDEEHLQSTSLEINARVEMEANEEKSFQAQNSSIPAMAAVADNEFVDVDVNPFDYSSCPLLASLMKVGLPEKVIWQYWHTSYDEMPAHIQQCIYSIKSANPKFKHILLTPENMFEYLDPAMLPSKICNFEQECHKSDAIRVAILAKYGGIYCDATVMGFKQNAAKGSNDYNEKYYSFDYIWDELIIKQSYDFFGFRYGGRNMDDSQYEPWKNDEKFCCWFLCTRKDNGLFYSWNQKIIQLMNENGGKISHRQLNIIDSICGLSNNLENAAFKKYVALGPGILDGLYDEYRHFHPKFRAYLLDPRDFCLLDTRFSCDPLFYLNRLESLNKKVIDEWFAACVPAFLKLFCAAKSTPTLERILKVEKNFKFSLKNISDEDLIISYLFLLTER